MFASALAGVVLYSVSFAAAVGFDLGSAEIVKTALVHAAMGGRYGTAVSAAVLSMMLAFVVALVLNLFRILANLLWSWLRGRRVSFGAPKRREAERAGWLRQLLLHDAMREDGLVEISLETGKSYVALVNKIVMGQPQSSDVLVVPLLSGYRHPGTQELYITTNYFRILDRRTTDRLGDLAVGIPVSRIVSVRPFDLAIWGKFHQPERPAGDSSG